MTGPINAAVFWKTLRDESLAMFWGALALLLFQLMFVAAMARLAPEAVTFWRRFGFMRQIFQAMFNINLDNEVNMNALAAVGFSHPMLLTLACGCVLASCTRVISGEFSTGTADLLLSIPTPRWKVFISVTLAWLQTAAVLCGANFLGIVAASWYGNVPETASLGTFGLATANLFLLLAAVGAFAMCVSAFSNRRSVAVGFCVGALVLSYLIGFLEIFFQWVRYVRWTGLLYYYQPTEVVLAGAIGLRAACGLSLFAIVFWTIGLWRFQTRDVPCG